MQISDVQHYVRNQVWDTDTLSWVVMTAAAASGGGLTDAELRASPVPVLATIDTTGLATSAGQTTGNNSLSAIDTKLGGTLTVGSHAVTNAGTFAVQATGAFFQATQPVSGTFFQATQPVSGTVTANAGTGPFPVSDNAGTLTVDAPVGTPVFVRLSDGSAAIATLPVSGTVTANAGTNLNTSALLLDATFTGRMPAAAAAADGLSNPTISQMGSDVMLYNGTTWDRARGNWRTTTGDTGAKTVTFNGATQTNFDAVGAWVLIQLGTVSGTTPTLAAQLQVSYDAGTTFVNFGPALANLTASSQTGSIYVYPANISQAAGATPANMTTGATVSMFLNMSLPRTWRLQYTIGGTTPSFAFTAVHVNYLR